MYVCKIHMTHKLKLNMIKKCHRVLSQLDCNSACELCTSVWSVTQMQYKKLILAVTLFSSLHFKLQMFYSLYSQELKSAN